MKSRRRVLVINFATPRAILEPTSAIMNGRVEF